jgi:hypothetical protein
MRLKRVGMAALAALVLSAAVPAVSHAIGWKPGDPAKTGELWTIRDPESNDEWECRYFSSGRIECIKTKGAGSFRVYEVECFESSNGVVFCSVEPWEGSPDPDFNGTEEGADELERVIHSEPAQVPRKDPDPGHWNQPGVSVPTAGGPGKWLLPDLDEMCVLYFTVKIGGEPGQTYSLTIDWGDGTTTTMDVIGGQSYQLAHQYLPNDTGVAQAHKVHMKLAGSPLCVGFIARHKPDVMCVPGDGSEGCP